MRLGYSLPPVAGCAAPKASSVSSMFFRIRASSGGRFSSIRKVSRCPSAVCRILSTSTRDDMAWVTKNPVPNRPVVSDPIELFARTAAQQCLEFRNAEYPSVVGNNQIVFLLEELNLHQILSLPRTEIVGVLEELEGPANPGRSLAVQSQDNPLENAPGIVPMCLFPIDPLGLPLMRSRSFYVPWLRDTYWRLRGSALHPNPSVRDPNHTRIRCENSLYP